MTAVFQQPMFQDEAAAREALEAVLWPNGPLCPHCGNSDPEKIAKMQGKSARPGLYFCNECKAEFTVTVGTVFERSKISLTKWWMAAHLLSQGKNGVSAAEIQRQLGVTYKTAWFMMHRLREAMSELAPAPMGGEGESIQVDETYYGNTSKRAKGYKKGLRHKAGVVALVEPKTGRVRAKVMRANAENVRDFLVTNVHRTSELHTDQSVLYTEMGKEFAAHKTVQHGWGGSHGEYVGKDGNTTNNVENFFLQFKRGMRGTYIHVNQQHLQRYLNEFSFRYSNRSGLGIHDGERTALLVAGAAGKRLTYRPVG